VTFPIVHPPRPDQLIHHLLLWNSRRNHTKHNHNRSGQQSPMKGSVVHPQKNANQSCAATLIWNWTSSWF
jgi:hypothetical protein